jgi:hypothetical protein
VHVRVAEDAEASRLIANADALGVPDPIEDGRLRTVDGRCVFQADDGRCRVHASFGAAAKPAVCQQYPLVAVQTEVDLRVGVDPGCYTAWATWEAGPEVAPGRLWAGAQRWPPDRSAWEGRVLAWLSTPELSVEAALGGLLGLPEVAAASGGASSGGLDAARARLGRIDLADRTFGPAVRAGLAAMQATDAAPRWSPARTRWAVEVTRRSIWLRLHHALGAPTGVAFLLLQGARLAAALDDDAAYGASLAAWSRALRAGPFARALLGDGEGIARWMEEEARARGEGAPGASRGRAG